jgi:hypothetical protein
MNNRKITRVAGFFERGRVFHRPGCVDSAVTDVGIHFQKSRPVKFGIKSNQILAHQALEFCSEIDSIPTMDSFFHQGARRN